MYPLTVCFYPLTIHSSQAAALTKLKQRAAFWQYKLAGSPLEAHLQTEIKQKGKELRDFQDEVHELQVAQLEREAEALTKMSIEHSERVNEELQPVRGRVT